MEFVFNGIIIFHHDQHNFTDGIEYVPAGTIFAKPFFTYAPKNVITGLPRFRFGDNYGLLSQFSNKIDPEKSIVYAGFFDLYEFTTAQSGPKAG